MNCHVALFVTLLILSPCTTRAADLVLGTLFRDGAILQRDKPVPVWGRTEPGARVEVEFHGARAESTADANGRWLATLPTMAASTEPAKLVVTGAGTRRVINDVLVGDVWLCSGQSNMFFYVRQADHAVEEIANARHPLLREFLVKSIVSDDPLEFVDGDWETCSPQTVATFTAVGYFFARDLQREIHVPIGIIRATLGGSPIEGWLSGPALAGDPAFKVVATRWEAMRATRGKGDRNQPSGLYNGLIRPLEPFALAGFLWYQGEGNHAHPTEYGRLFRTMISQWRADFQQGNVPFLFVQLPGYDEPGDATHESWAWLREEQASALTLPRTGMAVSLDLGEPKEHHPTNKQEVGRRLALVALRRFYGRSNEDSGPTVVATTHEGAAFRVTFRDATGLKLVGDPADLFLIAGADRRFVRATTRLEGESVIVSAGTVPAPAAVRFEWVNVPTAYLKNAAGLPAPPFRTDHWPAEAPDVHRPK